MTAVLLGRMRFEERRRHRFPIRQRQEAAHVLGQAGTAEGEAGAQIGRGDIQGVVFAEEAKRVAGIDAVGGEHGAGLVSEGEFHGVIDVGEVFYAFRHAVGDDVQGRGQRAVDFAQQSAHRRRRRRRAG